MVGSKNLGNKFKSKFISIHFRIILNTDSEVSYHVGKPKCQSHSKKKTTFLELQLAWDQIFRDAIAKCIGIHCVEPSMHPTTLNDIPHVNLDDENPGIGDNVDEYPQHFSHLGLGNEDGGYYSDLMHYARDVFSPNNTGGSNQVEKSSKENSKLKPVEMKRKKRASAGSIKLQELLTEQNVIQKRALAILESDSPSSTHSHDFSINAAVTLINRMVDDELMTKGSEL